MVAENDKSGEYAHEAAQALLDMYGLESKLAESHDLLFYESVDDRICLENVYLKPFWFVWKDEGVLKNSVATLEDYVDVKDGKEV